MDHQGLAVAEVGQVVGQLDGGDEPEARLLVGQAEREQGPIAFARELPFGDLVRRAVGKARVVDPFDLLVAGEVFGKPLRVGHMPFHAESQRVQADYRQVRVEGGRGRAEVDVDFPPDLVEEGRVGPLDGRKLEVRVFVQRPGKFAAVDDDTADGASVAVEKLRKRVNHDVGAVFYRPEKVRSDYGVVHNKRDRVFVRYFREPLYVGNVHLGVADGLDEDKPGPVGDRRLVPVDIGRFDHFRGYAETRQHVGEQQVRGHEEAVAGDDFVAGRCDRHYRVGHRGHAGAGADRAGAALEGRYLALQHVVCGVAEAHVDVARLLSGEHVPQLLGCVEAVAGRLVDRRQGSGLPVLRRLAGVDDLCVEFP